MNKLIKNIDFFYVLLLNIFYLLMRIPDFYRPLWNDELITIKTTSVNPLINPLYDGVSTNLPFFYYIVKLFSFLFEGQNLRVSSLVFSIIILNIFLYRYLKEKDLSYFIAGILLTFMPIQIYYSLELRTYMLTQLLLLLQFFFLKDYIEGKKVNFYFWGISIFLSLISHYTSYIFVLVSILYLIFKERKISESLIKTYVFPCIFGLLTLVSVSGNQGFTNSTENSILNLDFSRFTFFNLKENFLRLIEVMTIYYNFGLHYYRIDSLFNSLFKKFMYFFFFVPLIWVLIKNKFQNLKLNYVMMMLGLSIFFSILFDLAGFMIFASRYIFPFHFMYILLISIVLKEIYERSKVSFFVLISALLVSYNLYNTCLYLNLDTYIGNEDPQGSLIQTCFK